MPGQPVLTAAAGAGQVSLSWTTPPDGGSSITNYKIYRSTSSGTEVLLTTVGVVNGYANTGLTNGTTYWYQVSAVNAAGEGVRSAEKSAKPVTVPSVPRFFTAAKSSLIGINLHWQAPTSNGGSAITGYEIYRSTTSGTEVWIKTVGVVTAYQDTATTRNVRYYYVIRAINAVGNSAASSEATAVAK
jgi:fibronectin type 3 domain-containing protein